MTSAAVLTPETPEDELVARAASGDGAAFEILMRRHNQLLFRTARSYLRDDAEAEDALQDAYLHAWRALGSFRGKSRLSTWLVRIVTNEALGRLRRAGAPTIPLEAAMTSLDPGTLAALTDAEDRGPERSAERAQVRNLMETRIDDLPDVYRTVFMLRGVQELTVEEVAEALDVPQATVRTRYFRARRLLRQSLASELDAALGDAFAFDGSRCDRLVAEVLRRGGPDGRPG
jgi:RNA polymerase sigma-70 factor (ECF subfamily)